MALRSNRITPFQESSTAATTPAGTAYNKVLLNFGGQKAYAFVPSSVEDWDHTNLVVMNHGYADNYTFIDPNATPHHGANSAMSFLDQGWIVVSHDTHGNNWGNDDAISDVMDVYDWAARKWYLDKVAVFGFSMGGMLTYNVTGNKVLPQMDAAITINGVVNARTNWQSELTRVYGGTTPQQTDAAMAGHDPARDDPQRWAGIPFFISSSPNDTVCPTPAQAQVFYDRAATKDKITFKTHSENHLGTSSFMVSDVLAWLNGLGFVKHNPNQVKPAVAPSPKWSTASSPTAAASSGVLNSAGDNVLLYTTDGVLVSVSGVAA